MNCADNFSRWQSADTNTPAFEQVGRDWLSDLCIYIAFLVAFAVIHDQAGTNRANTPCGEVNFQFAPETDLFPISRDNCPHRSYLDWFNFLDDDVDLVHGMFLLR